MSKIFFYLILSGMVWFSGQALAANYDDPVNGVFRGVFGNTITVEVPSLVSKSPTSGDQNGNLTFDINASTGYRNFNQLSDLKDGDEVSVEYTQDPTSKTKDMVATAITEENPQVTAGAPNGNNTIVTTTPPAAQTVTTTTTRINPQ